MLGKQGIKMSKFMKGDIVFHVDANEPGREGWVIQQVDEKDIYFSYQSPAPQNAIHISNKDPDKEWYRVYWNDTEEFTIQREDWLELVA